jgi:hypothetical protein
LSCIPVAEISCRFFHFVCCAWGLWCVMCSSRKLTFCVSCSGKTWCGLHALVHGVVKNLLSYKKLPPVIWSVWTLFRNQLAVAVVSALLANVVVHFPLCLRCKHTDLLHSLYSLCDHILLTSQYRLLISH